MKFQADKNGSMAFISLNISLIIHHKDDISESVSLPEIKSHLKTPTTVWHLPICVSSVFLQLR